MHSIPQDIANESGSDFKTNQQDQYVDFNVSGLPSQDSSTILKRSKSISVQLQQKG